MRFVVTGEWTRNRLLMAIVWLFLLYTTLLWITNGMLYFKNMTLDPQSVVTYYLGDEASYRQGRSYGGLLEVAHAHLFAMGVLLLTLTHLLLFVPMDMDRKAILIVITFFAGLVNEAAGWMVRFVHPAFAYAKVGGFLVLESSILLLMVLTARAMLTTAPSAYTQGQKSNSRPDAIEEPAGDS